MVRSGPTVCDRRFTALGFRLMTLEASIGSLRNEFGSLLSDIRRCATFTGGWVLYEARYERVSSLYPSHVHDNGPVRGKNGRYSHDIFIAVGEMGSFGRVAWVLSPYQQILAEVNKLLLARPGSRAPQYVWADMKKMYSFLASNPNDVTVKRVILRIVTDSNAEIVSLTGRNPLQSDIHRSLAVTTLPFGAGAEIDAGGVKCRVTIRQVGIVEWYQYELSTIEYVIAYLISLDSQGIFYLDRRFAITEEVRKATSYEISSGAEL